MTRYEEIIEETAKFICEKIVAIETWPEDKDKQDGYKYDAIKFYNRFSNVYAIYLRTGK